MTLIYFCIFMYSNASPASLVLHQYPIKAYLFFGLSPGLVFPFMQCFTVKKFWFRYLKGISCIMNLSQNQLAYMPNFPETTPHTHTLAKLHQWTKGYTSLYEMYCDIRRDHSVVDFCVHSPPGSLSVKIVTNGIVSRYPSCSLVYSR